MSGIAGRARPRRGIGALLVCISMVVTCMGRAQGEPDKITLPPPLPAPPPGISGAGGRYQSEIDGMPLVLVPAGEFIQGSDDGAYDERPAHRVHLSAYLIDVHEVTNDQFARFVNRTAYGPAGPWRRGFAPDQGAFPVRFVTWNDAQAYARWAQRRLPTEAQWERAARGDKGQAYPWGAGWRDGLARTDLDLGAGPTRAGAFPAGASPFGCLDMAGNVWEWVADWYDRYGYDGLDRAGVTRDPTGPADGAGPAPVFIGSGTAAGNERSTLKVIRGGGWVTGGRENCRSSKRMWGNPAYWFEDTGFRCAVGLRSH